MNHRSATAGDFRSAFTPDYTAEKVRVLLIEDDEIKVIAFQRAAAARAMLRRAST